MCRRRAKLLISDDGVARDLSQVREARAALWNGQPITVVTYSNGDQVDVRMPLYEFLSHWKDV